MSNADKKLRERKCSLKKFWKIDATMAAGLGFLSVLSLLQPKMVSAFVPACPVCVIAIGSGLGISRALGVDDALVGIWLGALILALASYTAGWIKKKWPNFALADLVAYGGFYLLTLPFFFIFGLFGQGWSAWLESHLLIGMMIGTLVLLMGLGVDSFLRSKKLDGKAFFPFQKVIVPVALLLIATLVMWFVI